MILQPNNRLASKRVGAPPKLAESQSSLPVRFPACLQAIVMALPAIPVVVGTREKPGPGVDGFACA